MGVMKFVLPDKLEGDLRGVFRKKGDLSKIAALSLRNTLDTMTAEEILEAIKDM